MTYPGRRAGCLGSTPAAPRVAAESAALLHASARTDQGLLRHLLLVGRLWQIGRVVNFGVDNPRRLALQVMRFAKRSPCES